MLHKNWMNYKPSGGGYCVQDNLEQNYSQERSSFSVIFITTLLHALYSFSFHIPTNNIKGLCLKKIIFFTNVLSLTADLVRSVNQGEPGVPTNLDRPHEAVRGRGLRARHWHDQQQADGLQEGRGFLPGTGNILVLQSLQGRGVTTHKEMSLTKSALVYEPKCEISVNGYSCVCT